MVGKGGPLEWENEYQCSFPSMSPHQLFSLFLLGSIARLMHSPISDEALLCMLRFLILYHRIENEHLGNKEKLMISKILPRKNHHLENIFPGKRFPYSTRARFLFTQQLDTLSTWKSLFTVKQILFFYYSEKRNGLYQIKPITPPPCLINCFPTTASTGLYLGVNVKR